MPKKITTEGFIEKARTVHGDKYDYYRVEYNGALKKVVIICPKHGEFKQTPHNHLHGQGCPECGKVKTNNARRLTHIEQVEAINKVNPNVEALEEIKGDKVKTLFRCKICGHEWRTKPTNLKNGNGCPECGEIRRVDKRRLTHTEQIAAIAKINPDVEVLGEIINNTTKVLCRCKICSHEWNVAPYSLKQGNGCPKCAGRVVTHTEHVEVIAKVNPDIEVLGKIKKARTKVFCRCKVCNNEWFATPDSLKHKHSCPRCAKYGFHSHETGKLYIMVDDLELPTMMKIGVSVQEDERSKQVLRSAHKAGVSISDLYVAKTWEGPTELMMRIEQMMHENYAEWNIKFPTKFDGSTEFFYYTPETAGVFDAIEEIYYTVVNQF